MLFPFFFEYSKRFFLPILSFFCVHLPSLVDWFAQHVTLFLQILFIHFSHPYIPFVRLYALSFFLFLFALHCQIQILRLLFPVSNFLLIFYSIYRHLYLWVRCLKMYHLDIPNDGLPIFSKSSWLHISLLVLLLLVFPPSVLYIRMAFALQIPHAFHAFHCVQDFFSIFTLFSVSMSQSVWFLFVASELVFD